jgi:hypothetical protein
VTVPGGYAVLGTGDYAADFHLWFQDERGALAPWPDAQTPLPSGGFEPLVAAGRGGILLAYLVGPWPRERGPSDLRTVRPGGSPTTILTEIEPPREPALVARNAGFVLAIHDGQAWRLSELDAEGSQLAQYASHELPALRAPTLRVAGGETYLGGVEIDADPPRLRIARVPPGCHPR